MLVRRAALPLTVALGLLAASPVATGSGWATVMPNLVPLLDDEIQQVNGTIAAGSLRTGTRHILLDALAAQDTASESRVNELWPPLPPAAD